jgi:hypothetical protein
MDIVSCKEEKSSNEISKAMIFFDDSIVRVACYGSDFMRSQSQINYGFDRY